MTRVLIEKNELFLLELIPSGPQISTCSVPLGTLPFTFSSCAGIPFHLPHEGIDRVQGSHVESCWVPISLASPCMLMESLPETKGHWWLRNFNLVPSWWRLHTDLLPWLPNAIEWEICWLLIGKATWMCGFLLGDFPKAQPCGVQRPALTECCLLKGSTSQWMKDHSLRGGAKFLPVKPVPQLSWEECFLFFFFFSCG